MTQDEPAADSLPQAAREFLAPRKLLTGAGSSRMIGSALRASGVSGTDVVVVGDRVVAERGLLAATLDGLAEAGFTAHQYAEIAGEPDADVVGEAGAFARSHSAAAIVGVGGGSSLDTAKLVALLAATEGGLLDVVDGVGAQSRVAPLALAPTTTGTGSEATRIAMFSVHGTKRIVSCPSFVPHVAVLDPDLVADLPAQVVAATGMDALAHAVESMFSRNRSSLTMMLASEAATRIVGEIEVAATPEGEDARGGLLFAAYLAGLALNAGVLLGHSIGYVIAHRAQLAHGTACALALPYCIAYNRSVDSHVGERITRAVGGAEGADLDACAAAVEQLAQRLGLPVSLDAVGIGPGEVGALATEIVQGYPRPNNPVPLDEQRVRRLLEFMHEGDLPGACTAMAA